MHLECRISRESCGFALLCGAAAVHRRFCDLEQTCLGDSVELFRHIQHLSFIEAEMQYHRKCKRSGIYPPRVQFHARDSQTQQASSIGQLIPNQARKKKKQSKSRSPYMITVALHRLAAPSLFTDLLPVLVTLISGFFGFFSRTARCVTGCPARRTDHIIAGIAVWLGDLVVGSSGLMDGRFWGGAWVESGRRGARGRYGSRSLVVRVGVPGDFLVGGGIGAWMIWWWWSVTR
jgi:hypothetical protein